MQLSASYRYSGSNVRIHAGEGALGRLAEEVGRTGARRAFVVCGRSVAHRTELLKSVESLLGASFAGAFDGVRAESPVPSVEAGVEQARAAGADLLIALGGGSAVVTARAMLILLSEEGSAHDLCTKYPDGGQPVSPRLTKPKLPNIVILTTPTTAANRAGAAVMDPEQRHRLELFDPKTRPTAVFLDPQALLTAPPSLYLSTATTTFTGVVGALQARNLNPLAHADLRQALDLSLEQMPQLVARPDDPDVRLHLATAALLANRASDAPTRAGGGVASGLAHQLQTRYDHVDQGRANGVLAAPAMRFNRDALAAEQARLAAMLGVPLNGDSEQQAADRAAEAVAAFLGSVNLPLRLRDLDVPRADLAAIAGDAMHDFFLRGNARPVRDAAELVEVLEAAW